MGAASESAQDRSAGLCTRMLWRSGAHVNLHVMGAVLLFQVIWNVAVAFWLVRARAS